MKQKELDYLSNVNINYLFFGFYFLFIALIHCYHVLLIEPSATFSRYFYFFYALMQCAIETLLLILFANGMKLFFKAKAIMLYSVIVFFLLLTHVIDFPLVRFMDMSFWYALNFISAETPQNFLELLYASNVSLGIWFLAGLTGLGLLLLGFLIYRLTEKWTRRRPWIIHYPLLAALLCTLCLLLISWDYSTHKWAKNHYGDLYRKTLPWKSTFFREKQTFLPLEHRLKRRISQEEILQQGKKALVETLKKKPDIFLFIVESLREDFIDNVHAPHLAQFKRENLSFDLSLSNANNTHSSWYSLFYSDYPFYWERTALKFWNKGSIPLILLKQLGYKIHCFSSARLNFYQMDQRIFGTGNYLADVLFAEESPEKEAPYVRDQQSIEKLLDKMQKEEAGGRLFIVFLDATHLDYSWPEKSTRFTPCDDKINYLKAAVCNADVEKIKNRYRNSLFFVDSLFGKFMQKLKRYVGCDEALVVVTGDHGEEFYEQGRLFHASSLSHVQTHVPLYYKLGTSIKKPSTSMSCHMDIFPTLFHHLTGHNCMQGILKGESIFQNERWPYVIITRFNASRSPCEFCIHNGERKITLTFSDERDIFKAKGVRILSTKNLRDEILPHDLISLKEQFNGAFDQLFGP